MSKVSESLIEISKQRGLTEADKRWFTKKIKEERRHEIAMKTMEWFLRDPEAKYYVGVASGAAIATTGTILGDLMSELDIEIVPAEDKEKTGPWWGWLIDPYGSVVRQAGDPLGQWPGGKAGPITGVDFSQNLSDLMAIGGGSFAAWCASVIILRSIFSGTDLGEMMSGLGEIIPG